MGKMIEPSDEPEATRDIARVRFHRKWCEITAKLGIYRRPDARPEHTLWARKIYPKSEDKIGKSVKVYLIVLVGLRQR